MAEPGKAKLLPDFCSNATHAQVAGKIKGYGEQIDVYRVFPVRYFAGRPEYNVRFGVFEQGALKLKFAVVELQFVDSFTPAY